MFQRIVEMVTTSEKSSEEAQPFSDAAVIVNMTQCNGRKRFVVRDNGKLHTVGEDGRRHKV